MNVVSEYRLRNDLAETRQLGPWVEAFARRIQLSAPLQNAIDLALTECVTNVISHAYDGAGEHWLVVRFKAVEGEVRVEVEDDGRPFNPLTVPSVDVSTSLDHRSPGGLGVHMMRRLMDAVEYRRENGRNILTLIKRTK